MKLLRNVCFIKIRFRLMISGCVVLIYTTHERSNILRLIHSILTLSKVSLGNFADFENVKRNREMNIHIKHLMHSDQLIIHECTDHTRIHIIEIFYNII